LAFQDLGIHKLGQGGTNLENLKYSGNSLQSPGKIITNKIVSPEVVSGAEKGSKIRLRPDWAYSACSDYHYHNYFLLW